LLEEGHQGDAHFFLIFEIGSISHLFSSLLALSQLPKLSNVDMQKGMVAENIAAISFPKPPNVNRTQDWQGFQSIVNVNHSLVPMSHTYSLFVVSSPPRSLFVVSI